MSLAHPARAIEGQLSERNDQITALKEEIEKLDGEAIKGSGEIVFFVESYGQMKAKDLLVSAIGSLDENFHKEFEPGSASYKDRIDSLKHLYDKGFKTWVSIEPYPTPNIIRQDLMKILEAISFVDKIIFGRLNYNVKSSGAYN